MNKSIEARMENIDKEIKALREEISKDMSKPKPLLLRVGCGCGSPCVLCGSGTQTSWWKPKGCLQPECNNYWGKK